MEQPQQPVKRGAIVGTHPTYKATPWADQTIDIFSLNDAYILPGFARANGWFDLHPIPEMVFRPKGERKVRPEHAPIGGYLRPEGHLDWLKTRSFPVYLHDCREAGCHDLPAEKRSHQPYDFPKWPNARPFPFRAVEARFGGYFSSTPAWMLAWKMLEGYRDIGIFGIALATEWEYIHQRPNMEFLMGMALAQGITFTIPQRSALLRGRHKYAIEPKPDLGVEAADRRIAGMKAEGQYLRQRLATLRWYQAGAKADILRRLDAVELDVNDARQEQARLMALSRVA